MEIRAARAEDADALGELMVDTWLTAHHGQMPEHLWQWRRDNWTPEISANGWRRMLAGINDGSLADYLLVALEDDALVGLAAGEVGGARQPGTISALYVATATQRRHVGRRLLRAAAAVCAGAGARELHIAVLAANAPARAFYERVGGERIGERPFDEQGTPLPEIVYRWALPLG